MKADSNTESHRNYQQKATQDQGLLRYQSREGQGGCEENACVYQRVIAAIQLADTRQPTASGFITASELGQVRKRCYRISTGSKQLDTVLNGYLLTLYEAVSRLMVYQWLSDYEHQ